MGRRTTIPTAARRLYTRLPTPRLRFHAPTGGASVATPRDAPAARLATTSTLTGVLFLGEGVVVVGLVAEGLSDF